MSAPNPIPTALQETTENNGSNDEEYNSSGDEYKYPNEIAAEKQEKIAKDNLKDNLKEFMEETRHNVLKQWMVYRNLEKQKATMKPDHPRYTKMGEQFIEEKVKYEVLRDELSKYSEANGLILPCNGTYLYYRSIFRRCIDVIKPGYTDHADKVLQNAMRTGKLEETLAQYKKKYRAMRNAASASTTATTATTATTTTTTTTTTTITNDQSNQGHEDNNKDGKGDSDGEDGGLRRVRKNHNSRDAADAERYTRIELPTSYEEALQQALGHLSVQADKDRSDAGQLSIEEEKNAKDATEAFRDQLANLATTGGGGHKNARNKHRNRTRKNKHKTSTAAEGTTNSSSSPFEFVPPTASASASPFSSAATASSTAPPAPATSFEFNVGSPGLTFNDLPPTGATNKERSDSQTMSFDFGDTGFNDGTKGSDEVGGGGEGGGGANASAMKFSFGNNSFGEGGADTQTDQTSGDGGAATVFVFE